MENQPEGKQINFIPKKEEPAPQPRIDTSKYFFCMTTPGEFIGLRIPDGHEVEIVRALGTLLRQQGVPAEIDVIPFENLNPQ
jgi:hypothetical protein